MTDAAHEHLALVDPVMAGLIQASGRCVLQAKPARTPFQALVRAVAHQQLHGAAAETILRRFLASFPGKRFPTPRDVLKAPDSVFRKAGFSASKMAAIRDIAAKTTAKVVPGNKAMAALGDEEIVERLTECRGIGVWSVQMLLIFKLGRPDVLPVDDYGVRNGFRLAYGLPEMPKPKALLEFGERWRPHRTTASWYLWRAVDLSNEGRLPKCS
jgi:DNA-3-methyladenine glycosylase II